MPCDFCGNELRTFSVKIRGQVEGASIGMSKQACLLCRAELREGFIGTIRVKVGGTMHAMSKIKREADGSKD